MTGKDKSKNLVEVLLTELLRRKGHTIESARALGDWWHRLTWTPEERESFRVWWEGEVRKHYTLGKKQLAKEWGWFDLNYGLRNVPTK